MQNTKIEPVNEVLQSKPISAYAYTGQNKNLLGLSGFCNPLKIEKSWGHELIYQNSELYCCKVLYIKPYSSCSFHFHLEKHETLLVQEGTLFIDVIKDKQEDSLVVQEGEAFVVAPGFIHSLRAEDEPVVIIESSTPSYDTDSIRIKNGIN